MSRPSRASGCARLSRTWLLSLLRYFLSPARASLVLCVLIPLCFLLPPLRSPLCFHFCVFSLVSLASVRLSYAYLRRISYPCNQSSFTYVCACLHLLACFILFASVFISLHQSAFTSTYLHLYAFVCIFIFFALACVCLHLYVFVCICSHLFAFVRIFSHLFAFVPICAHFGTSLHLFAFVCVCSHLFPFVRIFGISLHYMHFCILCIFLYFMHFLQFMYFLHFIHFFISCIFFVCSCLFLRDFLAFFIGGLDWHMKLKSEMGVTSFKMDLKRESRRA